MGIIASDWYMSDPQDNAPQDDPHPNAGRASGYIDEHGNAIGEDLVNRVASIVASAQTQIMLVSRNLKENAEHQDRRFGYLLNQMDAFLKKEDGRHDAYSDDLRSLTEEVKNGFGVLHSGFSQIGEKVNHLEFVQEEQGGKIAILTRRMDTHERRLDDHDTRFDMVDSAIKRLSGEITEMRASVQSFRMWRASNPPAEEVKRVMDEPNGDER